MKETLSIPSSAMKGTPTPTPTPSTEATIDTSNPIVSATIGDGDSSCHNNGEAETSAITTVTATPTAEESEGPEEVTKEESAEELFEKGSRAIKDGDYVEAAECFSRALEIRVARCGELALECVNSYYKYGCALLYKAQEETDPLAAVPKKETGGQASDKDGTSKETLNGESSVASVSSNVGGDGSSRDEDGAGEGSGEEEQEEDDKESDAEDLAEAHEDESDLDLAWKMLDIARAILDKNSVETVEKVDVLSALAEVALEREDIETSLSDYRNALSILETLVEPDSRQIAELNFRICLCLEFGSKPEEAIPYCEKAISICKSRVQCLTDEIKIYPESASDVDANQSSSASRFDTTLADKESEIKTLEGLSAELEKKLEDLQQLAAKPTSILSEILGIVSAKAKEMEKKASSSAVMSSSRVASYNCSGGFDSPTVSTAHTNGTSSGITDLGVVGRGVKRVSMNSGAVQPSPTKKPQLELPEEKRDGNAS